jgi:2-iminobutanoate/2-iminopropanoate deaminase
MSGRFIETDKAPRPMGPYSVGVVVNGMVVTAGQLPIHPETGEIEDDIKAQARQCIRNIEGVLEAGGMTLSDVIKLTVFLVDMDDLAALAEVRREFWADPHPVSTTVESSRLAHPLARIEIDVLAVAN